MSPYEIVLKTIPLKNDDNALEITLYYTIGATCSAYTSHKTRGYYLAATPIAYVRHLKYSYPARSYDVKLQDAEKFNRRTLEKLAKNDYTAEIAAIVDRVLAATDSTLALMGYGAS